jgi:hypothetical protein
VYFGVDFKAPCKDKNMKKNKNYNPEFEVIDIDIRDKVFEEILQGQQIGLNRVLDSYTKQKSNDAGVELNEITKLINFCEYISYITDEQLLKGAIEYVEKQILLLKLDIDSETLKCQFDSENFSEIDLIKINAIHFSLKARFEIYAKVFQPDIVNLPFFYIKPVGRKIEHNFNFAIRVILSNNEIDYKEKLKTIPTKEAKRLYDSRIVNLEDLELKHGTTTSKETIKYLKSNKKRLIEKSKNEIKEPQQKVESKINTNLIDIEQKRKEHEDYVKSITYKFIVDEEYLEKHQHPFQSEKIGEEGTTKKKPTTKDEAFEYFEKYSVTFTFLHFVDEFNKKYSINIRTLNDELKTINEFITSTESIKIDEAINQYNPKFNSYTLEQKEYVKLIAEHYENQIFGTNDSIDYFFDNWASFVKARYFLFKEWLESEISKIENPVNTIYRIKDKDEKVIETIIERQKEESYISKLDFEFFTNDNTALDYINEFILKSKLITAYDLKMEISMYKWLYELSEYLFGGEDFDENRVEDYEIEKQLFESIKIKEAHKKAFEISDFLKNKKIELSMSEQQKPPQQNETNRLDEKYKTQNLFKVGLLFAKGTMNKYFTVNIKNATVMNRQYTAPKIAKELGNDSYNKYILASINNYTDRENGNKNIFNSLDMMTKIISHCETENIPVDTYFKSRLTIE